MASQFLQNSNALFIGGSNPSIYPNISDEETRNLLVLDGSLVPAHGKNDFFDLDNIVGKFYISDKKGVLYIIAKNSGYTLTKAGVITKEFFLPISENNISISENIDGRLSITTGNALYVVDGSSVTHITDSSGLKINNPNSCVSIDNFVFVSDRFTSQFQISKPNDPESYDNNVIYTFESKAGNIVALAEIDRTLFVIGSSAMERWVIVGGTEIVKRDNVFLEPYGLTSEKSLVDKFNMIVGLFKSKSGGLRVMVMDSSSPVMKTISTPGIIKKMQSVGEVISSDLYEIDEQLYYEIVFDDPTNEVEEYCSFIYCFNSKFWIESDSPFSQVSSIGGKDYGAFRNKVYELTLYENNMKKTRKTKPIFMENMKNFDMSTIRLFYTNPRLESGDVLLFTYLNGASTASEQHEKIISYPYGVVNFSSGTAYQCSFKMETYKNIAWRAMSGEINYG
jgi:hypothetical protein